MATSTDRIVKSVLLRASRERVWRAISDSKEFGSWFGVQFDGPFVAGASIVGKLMPTTVDAEVAKTQEPYKGFRFEFAVDRVEPMRLFSFRWHPFAVDSGVDYSKEPSTLVAFQLEDAAGGTMLTVIESGFDQIPLERRAKAFAANEGGWTAQMKLIEKYLAQDGED
ncbi:MAG: SRPBCC family protein [Candidatus Binatus sp.]|uniref:SRPBCC family protein n=1 Tax=Candidatus Binatus sp. TaxID=2811406 RepID=UPI003C73E270